MTRRGGGPSIRPEPNERVGRRPEMKTALRLPGASLVPLLAAQALATVVDHTCTDISLIPGYWIEEVKNGIQSHYAHTSHGSQLNWGLEFVENGNPIYAYEIGYSYLPQSSGEWCIFDGQEGETYITPDLYWQTQAGMDMTRAVLDHNPSLDTSMWCWCTQCDYYGEEEVQAYLDSLAVLESEYPGVTFVYFTGNAQGTGSAGWNRWLRNAQIRDYCQSSGRLLFDFEDLDSWWYNPASGWEHHTYLYNGFEIPAEHPHFYGDEYGHTTAESCEQKGRALWWLMALAAGWGGTGVEPGPPEHTEPMLSAVNPSLGGIAASYSTGYSGSAALEVFDLDGRLLEKLDLGPASDPVSIRIGERLPAGLYVLRLQWGGMSACEPAVVLQ